MKFAFLIATALALASLTATGAKSGDVTYLRVKQDDGSYKVIAVPTEAIKDAEVVAAPKAKKACDKECVCGSECKCEEGKCPGGCPVQQVLQPKPKAPAVKSTEIPYADAIAAVARGEHVVVFYRVTPTPVQGKWAYSDATPATGPGRYEPHPQARGQVQLVSEPILYYAQAPRQATQPAPAFQFAAPCPGGVCVGSR